LACVRIRMSEIQQAVEYPRNDDDWLRTLLIGGVLLFFSFLFVPLLLVYGYLVRVIDGSLDDEPTPPVFDEWGDMLLEGAKAWVVGLVYMLVPILVAGVTIGGAILSTLAGSGPGLALAQMFVGLALSTALGLVFGYVAVAAIVNFARVGTVSAGFAFGDIKPVLLSRDSAVAWLLSVGVFVVAGVITGVLNTVPLLGAVVGAFVSFYAAVVAAWLWADGFAAAGPGRDSRSRPDVGEQTV